jgi:hypothetical protein
MKKILVVMDIQGESDGERKLREEMLKGLSQQWHNLEFQMDHMRSRSSWERGEHDHYMIERFMEEEMSEVHPDTPAEQMKELEDAALKKAEQKLREEYNKPLVQQGLIEKQMGALSGRFARPHEHMNEEERYWDMVEARAEARERERADNDLDYWY